MDDGLFGLLLVFAVGSQWVHAVQVNGIEEPVNVIADLSHWNGNVDFKAAKADGMMAVMLKATQGISYVDPKYKERVTAAAKEGLRHGAYHFLVDEDGKRQAEHFLRQVTDTEVLAVDLETNGRKTAKPKQAEDFVSAVYKARHRYPLVYGSASFLKDFSTPLLRKCPLWIAHWAEEPKLPSGWHEWVMWQYTDGKKGPEPHSVKGIGPCDLSKFHGTERELADFWNTGEHSRTGM